MNRNFKNIAVHSYLKEQIEYIALTLGLSQNEALKRIITPICEILVSYKKGANMTFNDSILSGSVSFEFSGRRYMTTGIRPVDPELAEKEAKAKPIFVVLPKKEDSHVKKLCKGLKSKGEK